MSSLLKLAKLGRIYLEEWYGSISYPQLYQETTLSKLIRLYRKTKYCQERGIKEVKGIEDFRSKFTITSYTNLQPLMLRVIKGDYAYLLHDKSIVIGVTSGTTGKPKLIPLLI